MSEMTLRELKGRAGEAEDALRAAIQQRFLPGMRVHVQWGYNEVPVYVVETYSDRVKVHNPISDKEYAVDAYRLVEFEEL